MPNDLNTSPHTVLTTLKTGAYWGGGLLYYIHNDKFVQAFSTIIQSNISSSRFEEIGSLNSTAYTNNLYNNAYSVYEGSKNSIDLSKIKINDEKELLFFNQEVNAWKVGDFIKGYYRSHSLEGVVTEVTAITNPLYSQRFIPRDQAVNKSSIQKMIDTSLLESRHKPSILTTNETVDNSLIKVTIRVTANSSPSSDTTLRFGVVEKPALISWTAAKAEAESLGGRLAVLNTKEKNDIITIFNGNKWIGGSDAAKEGVFKWVNGEAVKQGYQNWESIASNLSTEYQEPNDGINTLE